MNKSGSQTSSSYSPMFINAVLSLVAAESSGRTHEQLLSFRGANTEDDLHSFASELVTLLADGSGSGGPRLSFANCV
ncbi:hypothetical protein Syun_004543 [Stephania yunnanensis]|uniref:Uncharacterized protein n=1 Tax=Stephania yunnanensis TaxID=152371 RepID=A0AAP0L3E2_9MAGN